MDSVTLESILAALLSPLLRFVDAVTNVEAGPGLYALWGSKSAWELLGLGTPPDDRPLYVGKSETSLMTRPLCQHFCHTRTARTKTRATSPTGSSSPRRSFAALLRAPLGFRALPRNVLTPDGSANYGLSPEHDYQLTRWMRENLLISTWVQDPDISLRDVEDEMIRELKPPLNEDATAWWARVDSARKVMAAEARAWTA